jgi:hypothetical protein
MAIHDNVEKKIDRRTRKSIVETLSQGTFGIENPARTRPQSLHKF